jgi:myo-inositol 2-dehydrogenase/D-chiro-inositol 1-dehydrogenase
MPDVAIFGAGRIGKIHAGNLVRQPGVKLKYVVDPDAAAAKALAAQHGAQVGTGRGRVRRRGVKAVVIASSTDTHADLIERAAHSKKAIFCEKPVDLDYARAQRCAKT